MWTICFSQLRYVLCDTGKAGINGVIRADQAHGVTGYTEPRVRGSAEAAEVTSVDEAAEVAAADKAAKVLEADEVVDIDIDEQADEATEVDDYGDSPEDSADREIYRGYQVTRKQVEFKCNGWEYLRFLELIAIIICYPSNKRTVK